MTEFLWAVAQWQARLRSPEWVRDGELTAAACLAREWVEGESGRVHCVRGVAVEVMCALGADERGQERRTGAKCRRGSVAGRPRWRARPRFSYGDDCLTELLWQWLTPKPEWVRRWCSWQSWSTNWVLQHCQLEQKPDRHGLRDIKFSKSMKQTAASLDLENISKCWKQPQICLVGHFWARCGHFHEMAIKQHLFLIKFATTLL